MSVREFATQLRQTIVDLKNKGSNSVESDSLIRYLDSVISADQTEPSATEMERFKAKLNLQAEEYRAKVDSGREAFKATTLAGQNAIRTGFLLNGGASIALLAVIGNFTAVNEAVHFVPSLADSLILFVIGTFLIAISSVMTYLSHYIDGGGKDWHSTAAEWINYGTIIVGLSSFGFFLWGMIRAYYVFQW